jgi:hypothetical protein
VRNEEVVDVGKVERNILHRIKSRKANWMVTTCVGTAFSNTLLAKNTGTVRSDAKTRKKKT